MATELDKLVVKIEADLKGLKRDMAQANKLVGNSSKKMSASLNNLSKSLASVTATATKVGAVLAVAFGAIFVKGVIDTGIQIENLQIRLKALFGTAEEGERAFEKMLEFAGKVPFTLGEIQQASGNLAVVADDADELAKVLEITGNVASVTGLDFQQTAEQIQRSFSGGIASADVFRERGVRDLLGFSAGATVSAEETRKAFERVFGKGGTFGDVTDELANTLTGTISMIKDKFMQFQIAVSESFFEELKMQFGDLNVFLDNNQERIKEIGRTLGETLAKFTRFLVDNIQGIKDFFTALAGIAVINAIARLGASITTLTTIMLANPLFMIMTGIALGGLAISQLIKEVRDYIGVNDELTESIKRQNEENRRAIQAQKDFHKEKKKVLDQIKEEQNSKFKPEAVSVSKEFEEQINKQAQLRKEMFDLDSENLGKLINIFDQAGKSISDTFGKAIASGESFRQSMLDIFQSVVAQVISLIVQLTVIEPLLQRIRSAITGSGFNIFGLFGGGGFAGEPTGSMVYGARAMGGNVNPNMPYMVGERGAEMFVPKSAGTIVPNNQLGGGVVIEQNLNFATGVSQTVRAEVLNLLPAIKENTLSAVREARLRGGTFAKDFGA
tara:strand:+ start:64 stop:1908 length:1845 start_codon:yes stop_codon:yes gene_type:complete